VDVVVRHRCDSTAFVTRRNGVMKIFLHPFVTRDHPPLSLRYESFEFIRLKIRLKCFG
jgi:hypothetical protein